MSNYNSFVIKNTEKSFAASPQTCTVKEKQIKHRTVINPNIDAMKSIKIENLRIDVIDEEKGSISSHTWWNNHMLEY